MTEQENTKQEIELDFSTCLEMMGKMFGEQSEVCDCAEMISHISSSKEIPEEWMGMMSQMMDSCCGTSEDAVQGDESL
jgi:hypothetical protein